MVAGFGAGVMVYKPAETAIVYGVLLALFNGSCFKVIVLLLPLTLRENL